MGTQRGLPKRMMSVSGGPGETRGERDRPGLSPFSSSFVQVHDHLRERQLAGCSPFRGLYLDRWY